MTSERINKSRVFITSVIEGKTDLDERFDRGYVAVTNFTKNLSEKEAHDVLNKALDDRKIHDDVCVGLLVYILSDSSNAAKHYHDLTLLCRDSLKLVTDTLIQIIGEKYSRLQDVARTQLLWLVREMIKTGVNNVEGVVWNLLRQISGGDVSQKNIWLAETLVDILKEHRPWLDKFSVIVASVAYTYIRILEDHFGPQFSVLRLKEISFVMGLLRERFQDCMKIGRDLVRLLQNIAKIPELDIFWKDLLNNPTSLAPNFTGISQLLQLRTSRRYFVVRLTPEMEKKMVFLCTDVKFGVQKRYQEWFQRQYLNTPESQTLRCDLIRFIIGCIHPSNEVLCSDIIPRWAVIGWLLSSCTSPVATANAKLSLFYDWLFYSTETDNIMNIEPGILVMHHSLKPHPVLTASLLDFLCRIIRNFHPTMTEKVKSGVQKSLSQILEKRVVQSMDPLFNNPRMDTELRKLVRETFPEYCTASPSELKPEDFVTPVSSTPCKMDLMAETGLDFNSSSMSGKSDLEDRHTTDEEAAFSDENEYDDNSKSVSNNSKFVSNSSKSISKTSDNKNSKNTSNNSSDNKSNIKTSTTSNNSKISNNIKNNTNSNKNIKNNVQNCTSNLLTKSSNSTKVQNNLVPSSCDSSNVLKSTSTNVLKSTNTNILSTKIKTEEDFSNISNIVSSVSSCTNVSKNELNYASNLPNLSKLSLGRPSSRALSSEEKADFNRHLDYLEKDFRNILQDMLLEKDQNGRCNLVQKICDLIFSEDLDVDEAHHIASCLSHILSNDLESQESILPPKINSDTLDDSLNKPLYIIFENFTQLTEDDHRKQSLLFLLVEFHKINPCMGYHFLYFLKATIVRMESFVEAEEQGDPPCISMYKDLCKASGQKDFSGFILRDLQICCERDPRLISWIVPDIYQTFPKQTMGNSELLQMILERLDSLQLHDLVCKVLQGSLQMFDNNSFSNILDKSLEWETVEQIFLWQLARAHEIPVDCCLNVLPKLKFCSHIDAVSMTTHGEALSNILMMLRRESPSERLLKHLFLREMKTSDPTIATILQYWVQRYEDKMAILINHIVSIKQSQNPSPNKRKRNQNYTKNVHNVTAGSSVPLDQILFHLDHLRTACKQTKFFALSTMQEALQTAQSHCFESQKRKYNDLFALIEESERESSPPENQNRKNKQGRGRRIQKSRKKIRDSETEEETSEEEDIKKPLRKRKKNCQVGSDSD